MGSLEKHGSIITHLLSQVRLGMDLTKEVLDLSFSGIIRDMVVLSPKLLSQVRLGMDLTKVVLILSFSGFIRETW